jgi:hypothetical protein
MRDVRSDRPHGDTRLPMRTVQVATRTRLVLDDAMRPRFLLHRDAPSTHRTTGETPLTWRWTATLSSRAEAPSLSEVVRFISRSRRVL